MGEKEDDLIILRRFLRERLQRDRTTFRGNEAERENVRDLIKRTAEVGESNSLLLIGPRGSGKTTLLNAVLSDLVSNKDFCQNTLIVYLNGILHTDDRLALNAITVQMQLENATDGKVFGSFAENLAFLLASLKAGNKRTKSVVFILEEFDLFCTHHNQTLLYNLFDVSQSAQAPICVLGVTCRLDVIELLEKRVKSRFSHRQVFLFPNAEDFDGYVSFFQTLLSIPNESEMKSIGERVAALKFFEQTDLVFWRNHFDTRKYKFTKKFTDSWNRHITELAKDKTVTNALQSFYDFDVSPAFLKLVLFQLVTQLDPESQTEITCEMIQNLVKSYEVDDKVELLTGLSVLEICLFIAMKHHSEIFDRDPFNFEIIFERFSRFAKTSSIMQGIDRCVVLKSFEHLRNIEFILPVSGVGGSSRVPKEFEMHRLSLTYSQIDQAIQNYHELPTEVAQWAQSSIV